MHKILLIEDEIILRETLTEILEINDFEVVAVDSGEHALKALKKWQPHLILSDVMMVGMSGFELLEKVKQQQKLANIPFIFLSALTGENDRLRAQQLGAREFISKPFKSKDVIAILMKYLD